MTDTAVLHHDKKPRLKFIDMARSLAIILMLEGHFTGAALANEYRSNEYWLYKFWHNLHGLTSPLFFTVTGLIFVYLLTANNEIKYFENIRVKKGFKRVRQLIFWGYFIQLNIWSIIKSIYYGSEFHLDWLYAFHVLQSIGFGIFFLLIIYGVYNWIKKGAIYWYYLIGGLIMFTFYSYMKHYIQIDEFLVTTEPEYLPHGAPPLIQNMFYGPFSDFSFVRYSGYTILGGMLGSIIRINEQRALNLWFGLTFIVFGVLLSLSAQTLFHSFDSFTEWIGLTDKGVFELNTTPFVRIGQVIAVIGVLMLVDKYFNVQAKLFLKIGQNTLPIYVIHVIILYGGVFGFGLTPNIFNQNLHPAYAVGISAIFILLFALMVKYIEPLERFYSKCLSVVQFRKIPK